MAKWSEISYQYQIFTKYFDMLLNLCDFRDKFNK